MRGMMRNAKPSKMLSPVCGSLSETVLGFLIGRKNNHAASGKSKRRAVLTKVTPDSDFETTSETPARRASCLGKFIERPSYIRIVIYDQDSLGHPKVMRGSESTKSRECGFPSRSFDVSVFYQLYCTRDYLERMFELS